MKKTKVFFTLLGIAFISILTFEFGCSKDRIEAKPLNSYSSPNTYLNSKKQQEQEYKIDSCTNPPCPCPDVVGQQGTQLCIAKNGLMYSNGDTLVHFPFYVRLIELYKPKDMIYAQMPTVASGNILETGGEIRVRAFAATGGVTELSIRSGYSYNVKMPTTTPQNYMQAYYGGDGDNYNDWINSPSPALNGAAFTATAGFYSNSISQLGWLNCDYNRAGTTNHNLTFTSTTDSLTNVAIFIYFPSTKTVMQVFNLVSGAIPDGSSVKIIAIGVKADGSLYKFYQTQTVTSSTSVAVTMTASSDTDLTSLLDGL
jgi:hypothetical protein